MHRSYHALPFLTASDGKTATNALYGFASILYSTINNWRPSHLAVCFDRPEPTFRKKIYKKYQAQRPKVEENLSLQFPLAKDFLKSAGIEYFEKPGFEADDLIGTIAEHAGKKADKVFILSSDRDLIQLINQRTSIISPTRGISQEILLDLQEAKKKMGVGADKLVDYKALVGDSSDNYPGVPGIGPKTARDLISKWGSLNNIYKNLDKIENNRIRQLLTDHKKEAELSRELAQIKTDVDLKFSIDSCRFRGYNEDLKSFFQRLGFKSLYKRYFGNEGKKIRKVHKVKKQEQNKNQQTLF